MQLQFVNRQDPPSNIFSYPYDASKENIARFSQRLLSTVFYQQLITGLLMFGLISVPFARNTFFATEGEENILVWLSVTILIAGFILSFCYPDIIKAYPKNYLSVLLFTLSEAYFLSYCNIEHKQSHFLVLFFVVVMMTGGLTACAYFRYDGMTKLGAIYAAAITCMFTLFLFYCMNGTLDREHVGLCFFQICYGIVLLLVMDQFVKTDDPLKVDHFVFPPVILYVYFILVVGSLFK